MGIAYTSIERRILLLFLDINHLWYKLNYLLSKSESVKFSLIESVIRFFTVKSVDFH